MDRAGWPGGSSDGSLRSAEHKSHPHLGGRPPIGDVCSVLHGLEIETYPPGLGKCCHRSLACRLIAVRRERPRSRRTANERDELSPSHELPSDEAHNLAHHWTIRVACASQRNLRAYVGSGSDAVIQRCPLKCLVCPKAVIAIRSPRWRAPVSSLILIRRYRQAPVPHGAGVASGLRISTT